MGLTTNQIGQEEGREDNRVFDDLERTTILRELKTILDSPVFQPSRRCQQFLSYVVHHRLELSNERLKERTIGVDLFQRPVGYATGDDPVVRVQAGEVRRRLDQYYQATPSASAVRIGLRVGSYSPEFRWVPLATGEAQVPPVEPVPDLQKTAQTVEPSQASTPGASPSLTARRHFFGKQRRLWWISSAVGVIILAGSALIGTNLYRAREPQSALKTFWAPALSSTEPVLICLAKPSVYRPSVGLYQRHSKTPEKFLGQFARLSQKPDLQPDDKVLWGDIVEYPDYGLAVGDVYTAIRLSGLLGQIGKKNQVRIGGDYSFEDLRNSPAVIIGAFNNRWTMQMTSSLHFAFIDKGDQSIIQEEGPTGRQWYSKADSNGKAMEDYAVVTRLLNSRTGQFVVIVAGIRSYGTQAAGEFVTSPEYLQGALEKTSSDWERKNLQLVLHTPVTDGLPGPPQVVATYAW